jgi:Domain of unknown function (DUF4136)
MNARRVLLSVVVLLPFLSVSIIAEKITVDYDKKASLSSPKTYCWKKGTPASSPSINQRVIESIDKQLLMKGFLKVDAANNPDLAVAYHAAVDLETQLNTTDTGWTGWGYYGGGTSTTRVEKIPAGTLVVDVGEAKSKKLLWRGTATDTVSDKPEKVEKKINDVVEKMFKKFPPPETN